MSATFPVMSYCGPTPLPANLWERWNLDPIVLATMAIALGAYLFWYRDAPRGRACFIAGMAVLAIIFISPLCALTVALFSARVVHHVMLVAVAAPLVVWALIGRKSASHRIVLARLLTPLLVFHAVIFWLWHAPTIYASALASTPVYWAMQMSLLSSAALFWASVLLASPARAITALLAATVQMALLGAILVFSDRPLYEPHFFTSAAFGIEPLPDQQLAGLIMWVPASLPYLLVAMLRLVDWLRHTEARRA
ncbi:cytochrome c oxidase assembly protein [Corticibacterium sp. UT-5YL-CI-8]|nr:cytochrome c oxidase assembly protein [Tianweitania sp. UT-5YL-CI-8]